MGTMSEEILSAHAGKEGQGRRHRRRPSRLHDVPGWDDRTDDQGVQGDGGQEDHWTRREYAIVIDHNAPSPLEGVSNIHKQMREFAAKYGAKLYDVGEGVCHVLVPESGRALPGTIIIGADSHTCTYGALNSFATGVGSTDMAAALISGKMWFKVPETIKLVYNGKLQKGVYSKDVALHMVGTLTANGATYKALEIYGDVIDTMSVEARMTISNLAVETGAKVGLMRCDKKTDAYLKGRAQAKYAPVVASDDAKYERVVEEDLSDLPPQIACPPDVDNVVPIDKVEGLKLDQIFIGTCTNGRSEDLEIAAKILARQAGLQGPEAARGARLQGDLPERSARWNGGEAGQGRRRS